MGSLAVSCASTYTDPQPPATSTDPQPPATSIVTSSSFPSPPTSDAASLETAYEACRSTDVRTSLSLDEVERTLTVRIADAENTVTLDCVLRELATPQDIAAEIRTVRSQEDQRASDNGAGLDYRWSYVDQTSGVDLVIQDIRDI